MPVIETIMDKCKRCYSCIRNCPAKAIRIEHGQAMVMQERCIGCGRCVRVCAQKAKRIESGIENTIQLLREDKNTFAILAPSFPAAFPEVKPNQVVAALRALGFAGVVPVAVGADLVAREYAELAAKRAMTTIITTPCPAVVNFIEKYHPSLLLLLAPVVSPMIATGRLIKSSLNPHAKIVFIGPCIAKKKEKADPKVAGVIDEVLTYTELKQLFEVSDVALDQMGEEEFDQPWPHMGGIFPVSGGLLRTARLHGDVLDNEIIVTEGTDRVLEILRRVEEGNIEAHFLDLLFCEGCINGPAMDNDLSVFIRKDIVARYVQEWLNSESEEDANRRFAALDPIKLTRRFTNEAIQQPLPSEAEIKAIFARINKHNPEDELNCGACGYSTCREKALAVFQGRAELEMCFPYLIDRLERINRELLETQERLVRSARLASMGELAAGVAHEINNPLAGVLTYIKLMRKKVETPPSPIPDLQKFSDYLHTIEEETTRVSEIVKSLLEFARPSEPVMAKISAVEIVKKALFLIGHQLRLQNIEIHEQYESNLPDVKADLRQIQQVLLNLLINAAQAMPEGGRIIVRAQKCSDGPFLDLQVEDSGTGIAPENVHKIFDPFFTTKSAQKGTGLGLSTAYSIMVKHGGTIQVTSQAGKGTVFTVRLPIAEVSVGGNCI